MSVPTDSRAAPPTLDEENRIALEMLLWRHREGYRFMLRKLPRVVQARTGQANSERYQYREPTP